MKDEKNLGWGDNGGEWGKKSRKIAEGESRNTHGLKMSQQSLAHHMLIKKKQRKKEKRKLTGCGGAYL